MDVMMVAQEFSLTPSLKEHLERRVQIAFARTRGHIARIVVRLRDLNGPRGGRDKVCSVTVTIPGRPEVVIRDTQENMYNAIDSAVKRAAYRAMRMATQTRSSRRGDSTSRKQSPSLPA